MAVFQCFHWGYGKYGTKFYERSGYGSFTIGFKVDDIDIEYSKLKKLNVDFIKLPITHSWGCRSFWFKDPDTNIVNFVCDTNNK